MRIVRLFLLLLSLVLFPACGTAASTQAIGSRAGIIVFGPNSERVGGTVFVALVDDGKSTCAVRLCTIEHIAVLANTYGIAEISPLYELTGDFEVMGESGRTQEIMCATATTTELAFVMKIGSGAASIAERNQMTVHLAQNVDVSVALIEYATATSNALFGQSEKSGIGLITTGVGEIGPRSSGAPLVLTSTPNEVVGVLSGGSVEAIIFAPAILP